MIRQEKNYGERRLKGVLEELATGCSRYGSLTSSKSGGGGGAGRTKLDKERIKLCQREIVSQDFNSAHIKAIKQKCVANLSIIYLWNINEYMKYML